MKSEIFVAVNWYDSVKWNAVWGDDWDESQVREKIISYIRAPATTSAVPQLSAMLLEGPAQPVHQEDRLSHSTNPHFVPIIEYSNIIIIE